MEYKRTNDPERPHRYSFSGWEIQTLRAAYTEQAVQQERLGNSSSVSPFDRYVIDYRRKRGLIVKAKQPGLVAEVLETFHEATDEKVIDIVNLPVPDFENRHAIRRRQLGQWAAELAVEIRRVASEEPADEPVEKLSVEEEVSRLREELDQGWPGNQ